MSKYRTNLPQLGSRIFLTDGGMETTFIFHDGLELPCNAAFDLMRTREGRAHIENYYRRYIDMARSDGVGLILETPTWRASPDWGAKLGYGAEALAAVNRESVEMLAELRDRYETADTKLVVSGCVGPRGDGYDPGHVMSADEAEAYHGCQIGVFADVGVDMVSAMTMTNAPETIGVAAAAAAAGVPSSISFTLETDGRLPTGQTLGEAIAEVDVATGRAPAYYMINCAHPTHFAETLADGGPWTSRLRGLRANASKRSHAELDESADLDAGDPVELGGQYRALRSAFPQITVVGGCCGTDHRHIHEISTACRMAA